MGEEWSVGDIIHVRVNGVLVDRGKVLAVIQRGIYQIGWEHGPFKQRRV